ncbi:MAG: 2-hydroxyacyl-CoA dehydratase family protein [Desulfosudaceae bacterium]
MGRLRDQYIDKKYQTANVLTRARLAKYRNPVSLAGDYFRYPWFRATTNSNAIHKNLCQHRSGLYLEATAKTIHYVIKTTVDMLGASLSDPRKTVIHQEMITPEIFSAMGLAPFMAELLAVALSLIDPHAAEEYIDISEDHNIPPDLCSHNKSTIGLALKDCFPPASALVSSNLPCDGGMSSYITMEKYLKIPSIKLDAPHNFYNDKAVAYFTGELRRMITWLEKNTAGKMDWDKLKHICEQRNLMVEHELELWDMIRARPTPMASIPVTFSHLVAAAVLPGHERTAKLFKDIVSLAQKTIAAGQSALQNEKYRALLWNPPFQHAGDVFNWAEKAYGVALVMDSMTYSRRDPFVDTSSEESMLKSLGQNMMEGPMTRHTRGPAANYIEDVFRIVKQFDIDMLWVAGHVGCKNSAALNGMLREKCRENNLPVLIINYDLSDPRVCSREGIMEQINHFMENIMQAKRLDI